MNNKTLAASLFRHGCVFLVLVCAVGLLQACGGGKKAPPPAPSTTQMGGARQGIALNLSTAVTTLAGTAGTSGSTDDTGAAARFNSPESITTDGTNLYVSDRFNYKIRKIVIATGAVSSLTGAANAAAGQGVADGSGTTATFADLVGITTDGSYLYVVDSGNNKIRKIDIATAMVSSLTGAANTTGARGFADGSGTAATFNGPYDVTSDGASLYVTEYGNGVIRKIQ